MLIILVVRRCPMIFIIMPYAIRLLLVIFQAGALLVSLNDLSHILMSVLYIDALF